MIIKFLSPQWGHEQVPIISFLDQVRAVGYDGIEMWMPLEQADQTVLGEYLQTYEMPIVVHQHEANGKDFSSFKQSFANNLRQCNTLNPLLINSHTGHDYFTLEQQLELIDIAEDFSVKTGTLVCHETHRGRMGYSPQNMEQILQQRAALKLTADLSHWTCVTESMLENFTDVLQSTLSNTRHVHARVGFEEGPQVSDPRAPEWGYALHHFLGWWDQIVLNNVEAGTEILSFTTEFGPRPYMPCIPFTNNPVADQFEVNCFMKDLLRERYSTYV